MSGMAKLLIISDPNLKSQTTLGTLVQHTLEGLPRGVFESISYYGTPPGDAPDILAVGPTTFTADYTHILCLDTLLGGGFVEPLLTTAKIALYVCEPSPYLDLDVFPHLGDINKIVVPSVAVKEALRENSIAPMEVIEKASVVPPGINFKEYHTPYISSGELLREDILSTVIPAFKPQDFIILCDAQDAAASCHMFRHLTANMDNVRLLIRANRGQLVEVESIVNGNDIEYGKAVIKSPGTIQQNAALYLVSNLVYKPSTYGFWSYTLHEAACMNIPISGGDDYVVGDMVRDAGISLPASEFVPYERTYVNRVNSHDAAKAVGDAILDRHRSEAGTVQALAKFAGTDYKASAAALIKEAFGL